MATAMRRPKICVETASCSTSARVDPLLHVVQVEAYLAGVEDPVVFVALVRPGAQAFIEVSAGDKHVGQAGQPLATPPTVSVYDAHGNPVLDARVSVAVLEGNGTVNSSFVSTNAMGVATTDGWLGPNMGQQRLSLRSWRRMSRTTPR